MSKKTIWVNTLVKNEGRFIWFGIKSVIDYVDKILIWDTGSNDDTVEIVKLLIKDYPKKIVFEEMGIVDAEGVTKLRQKMLSETKSDWVLILDGDEVWWEKSIQEVVKKINQESNLYGLISPVINLVGDIYHFQEEEAGQYQILGRKGHYNIRALNRKIPGLYIKNKYPLEGFYTGDGNLIQSLDETHLNFLNTPIFHLTHLERSSKKNMDANVVFRSKKYKYELGKKFPKDYKFPEVFYLEYPDIVPSPWAPRSKGYRTRAIIETPLKKIKRRILK